MPVTLSWGQFSRPTSQTLNEAGIWISLKAVQVYAFSGVELSRGREEGRKPRIGRTSGMEVTSWSSHEAVTFGGRQS